MRKVCRDCGLVNFKADARCRRCGGGELELRGIGGETAQAEIVPGRLPVWAYFLCFILGVIAEFAACLPALANLGWRHSAAASVTKDELNAQFLLVVLHLPSSGVPWMLSRISEVFGIFYLVVPFTQIVFWTLVAVVLVRRIFLKRRA